MNTIRGNKFIQSIISIGIVSFFNINYKIIKKVLKLLIIASLGLIYPLYP